MNPSAEKPGIIELRLHNGDYRETRHVLGDDVFETDAPFPVRLVPHWLTTDGDWKSAITGTRPPTS